jgi:hypothetical protein
VSIQLISVQIYASYAASIVDLLDIHVAPYTSSDQRLEILDAGTGHGSLAMHLARAVASANRAPPNLPFPDLPSKSSEANQDPFGPRLPSGMERAWSEYRKSRNAIIHTVENIPANSLHAEGVVRGFRQGLYWPHIDFYTARVGDWLKYHLEQRGAFLSYASLDLPNVHDELPSICDALRPSGKLAVFTPSISQIAECQKNVEKSRVPLSLLKVVELGDGISTGRVWDVRYTTPRAVAKSLEESKSTEVSEEEGQIDSLEEKPRNEQEKVLVCRPRVGERIVGGGFVGIWIKDSRNISKSSDCASHAFTTGQI